MGCTIGEYFRDEGLDALIIYDDLSNHAIAYREMSLLMRRSPGREAYPGDVFYLHSRLLERAGKLAKGGTLPLYLLFKFRRRYCRLYSYKPHFDNGWPNILDTTLFNSGVRPAVNVELSVSRVGGAAQTSAIKSMTRALRLELAQYHELVAFAQFGTELDIISQRKLARGAVIVNLLKQASLTTYSFVDQTLMFFLLKENYLDAVPLSEVHETGTRFASYVRSVYKSVYDEIKDTQAVSQDMLGALKKIAQEFMTVMIG